MESTVNSSATVKTVETEITEVTVYTNRAMVTRRGKVALDGTEKELAVAKLPTSLQSESLRAGGAGTVAVKLLGVRAEYTYSTEPIAEKVAQIKQRIRELEAQRRTVQDAIDALTVQINFIKGLSEKSVDRFALSLARQQVGLDETKNLLEFLGTQLNDYRTEEFTRQREREELDRQIETLRQQLQQIATPRPRESYTLYVGIEPAGAGEFQLEVTYVVNGANWQPLYDLRVNSNGDRLGLSYLAEVQQSTGEDWLGVNLTLSTAKPGLGTLPPKLDPWYIDIFRPAPPRMVAARHFAPQAMAAPAPAAGGSVMDSTMEFAMSAPMEPMPVLEASNVAAEVSNDGGVITFRLDRSSDIPSDGAPHKTTIFSDDYPCKTEFIAVPRLVSFAYRQASVTNPSDGVTLLPGQANIFRDNSFVGTTRLENVAPGQEFKLNLGIDEGLKIERDLVEREVDKRLIGNVRRITYAYRLLIINLRDQETYLKLSEQLPVSRNEQVKVKLTRINPQIQPGEMGLLEWHQVLPPKAHREIYYQFVVEHPSEITVTGLNV